MSCFLVYIIANVYSLFIFYSQDTEVTIKNSKEERITKNSMQILMFLHLTPNQFNTNQKRHLLKITKRVYLGKMSQILT